MYDVQNNEYEILTESQLSVILSHIDIDLTLSIIDDIISKRPTNYNFTPINNMPAAFENNFKQILIDYSFDKDSINQKRDETYIAIINKVTTKHGLQFLPDQTQDLYSAAFYIYDFLISNFNNYLIKFFTNYINREKNTLYDSLGLIRLKKNKDSSTLYNKKIYKNNKLAIIAANLEYVVGTICTYDIPFTEILNNVYDDPNTIKLLSNILTPVYDFFSLMYKPLFSDISQIRPILLTNIRLSIQQLMSEDMYDNILSNQQEQSPEIEQENEI